MADTRRRRASTGRMMDEIMEPARSLPLTRQVLADSLETATPAQMEFMLSWMNEELASRERSKRARLPEQAGLPGVQGTRRLRLDAGPLSRRLRARGVGIVGLRRRQRGRGAVRPAWDRQDASRGRVGP